MAQVEIGRDQQWNPILLTYDEEFSFQDFTGQTLKDKDFSGRIIYGSVFSQEVPDSDILPQNLKGVEFHFCHLENVLIPNGVVTSNCYLTRYEVQNDLRDWQVDQKGAPIAVLNQDYWVAQGDSIDPKDIPPQKIADISQVPKVNAVPVNPVNVDPINVGAKI